MDHLNLFNSYEKKPLYHEDQLTRAFLILTKSIKLVEGIFLEIVIDQMKKNNIEQIPSNIFSSSSGAELIETQVWSTSKEKLENESGRLVSIIITDERLLEKHKVNRTERTGVYDGFIKFKPDWIFIIENKPNHKNIWIEQLSSKFNENYEIEEKPIILTWKEIIKRLSLLLENGLLTNTESILVEDFLEYVSEYFYELNPYDKFSLCNDNKYLLDKHCVEIMKNSKIGDVNYHRGWKNYIDITNKPGVKMVTLFSSQLKSDENWFINFEIYPGDAMSQARYFYKTLDIEKIRALLNYGWEITPNFHFAFRSSNLVWTKTKMDIINYLTYWKNLVAKNLLVQQKRENWKDYFEELTNINIISQDDFDRISEKIINTKMSTINICPGVCFNYRWEKDNVIKIEEKSKNSFNEEFSKIYNQVMAVW